MDSRTEGKGFSNPFASNAYISSQDEMRIMRRDEIGSLALSLLFLCGAQFVRIDVVVNGSKSDIRRRYYFSRQRNIYELGLANFVVCRVQSRVEHATCELETLSSNLSIRLAVSAKEPRRVLHIAAIDISRRYQSLHSFLFARAQCFQCMQGRLAQSVGIRRRVFSL